MLVFLGILFGAFAPWDDWWKSRAFVAGGIAAVMFTIVAFASYAVAPDWMWMYFLDPGDVSWSLPGLALGYLGSFVLGFASAIGFRQAGRRALVMAGAAMISAEIGLLALTWSRYHEVGTRAQWLRGDAHELFSVSPSGPVSTIGVLVPMFFVVLAVTLFYTWRSTRSSGPPVERAAS